MRTSARRPTGISWRAAGTPSQVISTAALTGWLLATTAQGFIPAQDRGYVIVSAQLPGAASLARTTEIVREIERISLDTPGIIRVAAFAGFSGATRTQATNAAALFPVFSEPEA